MLDIKASKAKDDSSQHYFFEIDGPSHFYKDEVGNYIANSATKARDEENLEGVLEEGNLGASHIIKIPFWGCCKSHQLNSA